MSATTQDGKAIRMDWGQGRALWLAEREGRFELTFDAEAPPKKYVKVDAIDRQGNCHMLTREPPTGRTMIASGQTEGAFRVRVYLLQDLGADIREVNLPGVEPMASVVGPEGGSLILIGPDGDTATVEVVADRANWKIVFADDGAKVRAPSPDDVLVQVIGPSSAEEQVRQLAVSEGPDANSLLVKGRTADASYMRLAVMDGNEWHTRCLPVP